MLLLKAHKAITNDIIAYYFQAVQMEKEYGLRKIEHEVLIAYLENIQVDNALDTYLVHHRYTALIDPNHRRWRERM